MSVKKDFRTRDIYYASFLKAKGVSLLGAEPEGRTLYFIFERVEDLSSYKNAYYGGSGEVGALKYAEALKNLKSLLHHY